MLLCTVILASIKNQFSHKPLHTSGSHMSVSGEAASPCTAHQHLLGQTENRENWAIPALSKAHSSSLLGSIYPGTAWLCRPEKASANPRHCQLHLKHKGTPPKEQYLQTQINISLFQLQTEINPWEAAKSVL